MQAWHLLWLFLGNYDRLPHLLVLMLFGHKQQYVILLYLQHFIGNLTSDCMLHQLCSQKTVYCLSMIIFSKKLRLLRFL